MCTSTKNSSHYPYMTSINITLKALATYRAHLIHQQLQINTYVHRKSYLNIFGEKINFTSQTDITIAFHMLINMKISTYSRREGCAYECFLLSNKQNKKNTFRKKLCTYITYWKKHYVNNKMKDSGKWND